MRSKPTAMLSRLAIVSLLAVAAVSPCTLHVAEAAPPAPTIAMPRQRVAEPMTWMVPTQYGYQPVEHAQPTLWIEGEAVTRYWVDRPGVERALTIGR